MPPLYFDAFGIIEQFATDGFPSHDFDKTGDLDLLCAGLGAAAGFDQNDGRFMQGDGLQAIPLSFFDEEEFVVEGGRFYFKAFDVVL
jgi:hypothetical protein